MPSKSKRRASRQAQLSGRRRRRGGRPRGATATAEAAPSQVQEVRRQSRPSRTTATASAPSNPAAVQTQQTAAPAPSTARRRSSRPRTPVEPLQMYPYLGSELRRIGVLTGLMAVTLAVLTIVLG